MLNTYILNKRTNWSMKHTFIELRQNHDYIGDQEEKKNFFKQNIYKGFLGWLMCQKAEDQFNGVGTAEITEPLMVILDVESINLFISALLLTGKVLKAQGLSRLSSPLLGWLPEISLTRSQT